MFAVFGQVSAGTPAKPNGADSFTISASFDVLAWRPSHEYGEPLQPGRSSRRRRKRGKRRSDLRRFWRSEWQHCGEAKERQFAHDIGIFRSARWRPSHEYGKRCLPGQGFATRTQK
ncbi:hypothetical protein MRX96_058807 [Rhipicephalus microplus]